MVDVHGRNQASEAQCRSGCKKWFSLSESHVDISDDGFADVGMQKRGEMLAATDGTFAMQASSYQNQSFLQRSRVTP